MSVIPYFMWVFFATQTFQNPLKKRNEDLLTAASDRIIIANEVEDVDSKLFEGDIEFSLQDILSQSDKDMFKRNAHRTRQSLWRTKKIPYEIDSELERESYNEPINAAIAEFHQHTCIRWVRHTVEKNWVKFIKGRKCSSGVGKNYWNEGFQTISLNNGCKHKGTILHEMMHATGFWHEQSRPDRNNYVEVMWENIEQGKEDNFEKYGQPKIDDLGVQYDYKSIMHYGKLAFSANGKSTLQAVGNPDMELGQRDGLSKLDKIKLSALYDCTSPSGGWSTWSDFTPCNNRCQKLRQRFCTVDNKALCPGADYYGIKTQNVKSPIDGHWGRWSSWSACSATCDQGTHTRTRQCDDPSPKRGGSNCIGKAIDRQLCFMKNCNLGEDDCQFDAGVWCHWTQDNTDSSPMDWERTSKPTPTSGTGPTEDHTSGSGYYIYAESSSPATKGDTTRLLSKAFPATSGRCITFWYYMLGSGVGALRVFLRDIENNSIEKIWEKQGNQGPKWIKGVADITSQNPYKVVLEAERGSSFQGDIALDDVIFNNGLCHSRKPTPSIFVPKPATEAALTTESESTAVSSTEVLMTKLSSTETVSRGTLTPSTRAPLTEASSTNTPLTKAPSTETSATEEPSTEVIPPSTNVPSTEAPATEAPATETPPIEVPSTRILTTEAPLTDVPFTEVPLTQAPPTEKVSTEVLSEPTDATATNLPSSEIIDDYCDFGTTENTFCTWHNDPTNSKTTDGYVFEWWWMKLPTPSANTGPSADHTTGSGYYIYLESSNPFVAGNKGRLLSKRYQSSTAVCLHFWYHMYGDTIGSLTTYIDNQNGRNKIWEVKGNQGNEWKEAYVPINSKSPFQIIIEGERGQGYTGDIGLDDVTVRSGSCAVKL